MLSPHMLAMFGKSGNERSSDRHRESGGSRAMQVRDDSEVTTHKIKNRIRLRIRIQVVGTIG